MAFKITEEDVMNGLDKHMILEANRLKSYKIWPFSKGICNKQNMCCAGFYHCNVEGEIDGVRCFCCFKELDGWDEADDPWVEHKNHQKDCYFATLGKPESQMTVNEFIKVIEEREVNLIKKRIELKQEIEKERLKVLGLKRES